MRVILFFIIGGVSLVGAILLRERQMGKERAAMLRALRSLAESLEVQGKHLRRAREDILLLHTALRRRNIVEGGEIERMRADLFAEDPNPPAPQTGDALSVEVEVDPDSADKNTLH